VCLRQEKERLDQERAGALEAGRRAGEELSNKSRELAGENHVTLSFEYSIVPILVCTLTSCLVHSAQSKYQEAPRRADQGLGLLEGQLHQALERSGPGS